MTKTTTYNYLETMKHDIKEYIEENISVVNKEMRQELYDTLWTEDSVTGNASGSYTFDRAEAKEYVEDNKELVKEMATELDCKEKVCDWWFDDDYEKIDIFIRCYLLGQAISEVLEEMEF